MLYFYLDSDSPPPLESPVRGERSKTPPPAEATPSPATSAATPSSADAWPAGGTFSQYKAAWDYLRTAPLPAQELIMGRGGQPISSTPQNQSASSAPSDPTGLTISTDG